MEKTERTTEPDNTVNTEENTADIVEGEDNSADESTGERVNIFGGGTPEEAAGDGFEGAEESDFESEAELESDSAESELEELRRISGIEYGSTQDFEGYERYLELKKSGILTAEEAFYAVNRGKRGVNSKYDGTASKGHMTASRRKPSSGAVFTRADREELAKWGISATGSELERLWRASEKR